MYFNIKKIFRDCGGMQLLSHPTAYLATFLPLRATCVEMVIPPQ